jgi:hypothetical protein
LTLSEKIKVVLTGCAIKTGYIAISCSENSTLNKHFDGTQVWPEMAGNLEPERFPGTKQFSLSDLLSENGAEAVLKWIVKVDSMRHS